MENNQSTYLTGLYITANKNQNHNNISKTPSISNELVISPQYDTYSSLPHPLDTRNQTIEFLKYSTYRNNLLKTEFLDFLLKEENFSNMSESEKFLREKAIEKLSIINKNNSEIEKKKKEYKKIIFELNKEINNNLQINQKDDNDNYKEKKEELQKKIELKKSDLNVLQTLYRKEYKNRYLLIQQQKSEVENIKINMKQYEKYNILSKKISIEASQKENLLNDVKNYVAQSREVFANEIDNKTKIYNDLEYEVLILKQNTESIEKNLLKIRDMKSKIKELIVQKKEHNDYLNEKNKFIKNNIFLIRHQILKNTEMKNIDLDSLIKNYNEIQKKMNKLQNDLFKANQRIADLNKVLHKLKGEEKIKKMEKKEIKRKKSKINEKNEDIFKDNFNEYILKDKLSTIKNKNKDLEYLSNSKLNIIILYLKYLFEYSNILYKSYDNSKLDFNFNLDNKQKFLKKIMDSKYYELVKWDQKAFKKILTNDNEIFKDPKNFLLFSLQILLNFFVAVKIITSNILNITCYNNEDLMIKIPLSQFNKNLISLKDSEEGNDYRKKIAIINKENDKVEIINFNSNQNSLIYNQYLNQSKNIISQRNIILSRSIDDILPNKDYSRKKSANGAMETNYPNKMFISFINDKKTHKDIKNSRYINNYPSTTLLSLKRFFGAENQEKLFDGFKSADKNKIKNNRYNQTKGSEKTIDTSTKIKNKNSTISKSSRYQDELSKEYNYELENEENTNKFKKKKLLGRNKIKIHVIKYSCDDPQKELIFARMNDIRNLELFANNSNIKSSNVNNDISNDKSKETKFYEMYNKFKQKYFYNPNKINNGYKNYSKLYKLNKKYSSSNTSKSYISNKNLNLAKGMKFIKNNSDFFYGVKTSKNDKNYQKIKIQKLPNIKDNMSIRQNSAELIDPGEGTKENL